MDGELLCESSVCFGYTPPFWSISSIFHQADIRRSGIFRHRRSERLSEGSLQPCSRVAYGSVHIRTLSDFRTSSDLMILMAAMVASVKIGGARVAAEPDSRARLDIPVTRLNCCLAAFCLLVVALRPLDALAQITESLLPSAAPPSAPQAPRTPYDPIGLRLGDFFWFPRAELDEAYNSNVFATPTSPTYDLITALTPSFDLLSIFPRNALNLHGSSLLQVYADHPAQNTQDGFVSADGRIDVTAGSSLYGNAQVAHQHISYGSPNSPGNIAQPVTYWDYIANAGYSQGGRRFSYRVDIGVEAAQYNAAPLVGGGVSPQSFQDATVSTAAARASYEIIPDYLGYIRFGSSLYDYWHTVPGGTRANFSTYRADVGLQIRPRHLISGEAYAGYLIQQPAQSRFGSTSTPDFGGRLTWSITQLTTLNLTGLMTFNTGTPGSTTGTLVSTTGAPGSTTFIPASAGNSYLSRTIAANADHELLRNLLVNLNATYGNFTFQGISRTDNFFIVGAGLRYLVNRNLFLGGSYLFTQYTSTIPRSSYNQNILTLRVGTQF
jgi:hypothetical protein